jgi:integrase
MKYVYILLALLVLNSCESQLEIDAPSELTFNGFWEGENGARAAHSGLYGTFRGAADTFWVLGAIRSDVWGGQTFESPFYQDLIESNITVSTAPFGGWAGFYSRIHKINDFLKNVPEIEFQTPEDKEHMLGQAYGLRAYYYYTLLKTWGAVPISTEILSTTSPEGLSRARAPKEEVMQLIKDDIERDLFYYSTNHGLVSLCKKLATKSKVLEYEKENSKTISKTELVRFIDSLLNRLKSNTLTKSLILEFLNEDEQKNHTTRTQTTKKRHLLFFCHAVNNCNVKNIDDLQLKNYRQKLLKEDIEVATINTHIKNVKTFLNWLNTDKKIYQEFSKNKHLKKLKESDKTIIALNLDERKTILEASLKDENLQKILDLFKLNCLVGLRYEDLRHIKKENINNNELHVRLNKGKNLVEIPITRIALEILEKYNYKIEVFTNQYAVRQLKVIFKKLNINRKATVTVEKVNTIIDKKIELYKIAGFKLARKTFITTALQHNMTIDQIRLVTGHSSNEIYKYTASNIKDLANKFEEIDSKDKKIDTLESKIIELESQLSKYKQLN